MSRRLSQLNRWLARNGDEVTLRRSYGPAGPNRPKTDLTMRAKVKGMTAEQLIGGMMQQVFVVVLSPTPIIADGWPHDGATPQASEIIDPGSDGRYPIAGDGILINLRERAIQRVVPTVENGRCVRIEVTAKG
jgi:hypothetical protein